MRRHLLVTNDFPPKTGGIQTLLWELWRRLPADRFAVLTTAHEEAAAFDAAQPFRIERTAHKVLLPTPETRRHVGRMAAAVGAELVMLDPVLPIGRLGPSLGLPYGVFMHGSELVGRVPLVDRLAGRILARADLVVAAGNYPAAEAARLSGRNDHVTVVPCGVDAGRFRPLDVDERRTARRRLGLPEDGPLVVGLSRLVPRKGFDVLIDAAVGLDGVAVAIGGTGRDRDRLEGKARQARDAGVDVRLVGRVDDDDLPAFYGCADAFAMLCRDRWGGLEQEGFGIVFLEAASCGVPQVAGRSGGSADAVVDGETGVIVDDPTDVDAVGAALRHVLEPATNARMRVSSRARAVDAYDYERLAASLEKALT